MRTFEQFMQTVTFEKVSGGVKIRVGGEPLQSIQDGDYIDATGFHAGRNICEDVVLSDEALAMNFLQCFFLGLASTNDAAVWTFVEIDD